MKRVIALLLILACTSMVSASDLAFWAIGEQTLVEPADGLMLRLGYEMDQTEVGIQTLFVPSAEPDVPDVFGIYSVFHLPDPIEVPNPIPLDWLPEKLTASIYLGGQISVDFANNDDGAFKGLIAGMLINNNLVIEYQYNRFGDQLAYMIDPDSHQLYFGLRIPF